MMLSDLADLFAGRAYLRRAVVASRHDGLLNQAENKTWQAGGLVWTRARRAEAVIDDQVEQKVPLLGSLRWFPTMGKRRTDDE